MSNMHTIEAAARGSFEVYRHGFYPSGSVLAGQSRRSFVAEYTSLREAKAAYPRARVSESTRTYTDPNATLEELSGLPETPPAWFAPSDANETW